MLAFEIGSEEVATNVRAFRECALCGPVKWLLVVDHFTLRRFKHFAYMYCVYVVGSGDYSVTMVINGISGAIFTVAVLSVSTSH